jgi:uncharacterized membrane protein YgaE (UPF0421/DUF939 family)
MTEDERTKIILGLCDTQEKQLTVCKYDKGTQTYYADVEEALRRIPQEVQCVSVKKDDGKTIDEMLSLLRERISEQDKSDLKSIKSTVLRKSNSKWRSR